MGTISPFEYDFRYVLHNDKGFHAYHSVTMGHSMPRLHVHPYHELLIRRGCTPTTYISPSFSATVDFPAVVFQRAVTLHAANADASMEYDRTVCYFTDEYVASFADAADIFSRDKFDADCIIFPLPEALQDEFFQIDEKLTDKTLSPVRRRLLFALLLNMVSETLTPMQRAAADSQKEYGIRLLEYVNRNFAEEISRESVAEHFHISLAKLDRDFLRLTSISMQKYLLSLRIGQASAYLAKGIPVEETAQLCGFRTAKYFTQCFKKYTGITPLQFLLACPKQQDVHGL